MVRRRFRVDRCEAERRVRAASGLRLVCGSSMVWPHLLHTSASVRRMPWHTHIMAHLRGAPHTAHRAMQRPHCPESPRHPRRPPPGTLCPAHTFGARKGVLETVAAVRARRRHVSHLVTGLGSRHGLGAQPGIRSLRIPAMALSRGDVRSSPMAYPAERPLPKLPLPLRPETWTTPQFNYSSGQVFTELNPAPSPSGHPLLSGPPT